MLITGNYLSIPYNRDMTRKRLLFYADGEFVFDIEEAADFCTPRRRVYLDCSRWKGRDIRIRCIFGEETVCDDCTLLVSHDGVPLIEQFESVPDGHEEKFPKPFIHYMRDRGWLSDPNGPVYFGGKYHVFFQTNPVSCEHKNMHWGHACSEDLFHWETLSEALRPDVNGEVFSGSSVAKGNKIILFYTAAGGITQLSSGNTFCICRADSNDGVNFTPYKNNPLLTGAEAYSRDPKVVFCEEFGVYLMLIYKSESSYALLSSENLRSWRTEQIIEIPGDSECPDIYKLYADGKRDAPFWIISGASDRYIVGHFERAENSDDGGKSGIAFVRDQRPGRLHYGSASYAGQSFFGTGDGDVKRLTWLTTANTDSPAKGQLSVPMQMSLKSDGEQLYLCALPEDGIKKLYGQKYEYSDLRIAGNTFLPGPGGGELALPQKALDITLSLPAARTGEFTLSFFGFSLTVDYKKNTVRCGDTAAPLRTGEALSELRIIADRLSFELFMDGGKFFISSDSVCDYNLNRVFFETGDEIQIPHLCITELEHDGGGKENKSEKIAGSISPGGKTALGIDVGSTTISFDLTDLCTGRELRSVTIPNNTRVTGNPYEVLYDADACVEIIRRTIADFSEGPEYPAPSCIGVTGQMHGILYVNAEGNALSPLYSWMDGTGGQPDMALGGRSAAEYIREATGRDMATGWGIATLLSHKANGLIPPEAVSVCTVADYVVMKLTGRKTPLMHSSNAASLGLFDEERYCFIDEVCDLIGTDASLLPQVTDKYVTAGYLGDIPVAVAIGDNQASFLASVREPLETVQVNIGTGSQISFLSRDSGKRPGLELRPLGEGECLQVGSSLCGGRSLSILESFFRKTAELVAGEKFGSAYKGIDNYLDALLVSKGEEAYGHSLSVDTLFEGTRAEPWRRGSVTGINADNFTPDELIKGFIFGMAEELKSIYDESGSEGARLLVASGGAVRKSAYLRGALERVFGMKVLVPLSRESAAYGSTIASAVAAGLVPSVSAARRMIEYA